MKDYIDIFMGLNFGLFIISVLISMKAEMDIGKEKPWYRDWYVWRKLSIVFGYCLLSIPTILVLLF